MGFKFASPVKLPRWTTEEFLELKRKYQAKYGSTIRIPGWEDIVKWDTTPEPTKTELSAYRRKDIASLGEHRYDEIKRLMAKKKDNFLRMLSAPTPEIIQNASSLMTTLDDVNDALGTFAVVLRVLARKLPSMFGKFLTGPAGWILTGAELAGVVQQLTCLPFKARNIQHELNEYVKGHPLSKKAKLRRLQKLQRLRLTKGELIEALQTTENMFGIGLSLGPIMGLLYDIPVGLYKHATGEKVTIANLPLVVDVTDRVASRVLKWASTLWTGLPKEFDEDLAKSMVAVNWSAIISRVVFPYFDWQSVGQDLNNILLPAPAPIFPSTIQVIEDELGDSKKNTGWSFSNDEYVPVTHVFNTGLDQIQENVAGWRERNKTNMESLIAAQNLIDAGLHIIGALESDDDIELQYDPHTNVMLKLLNQGYRYPCPMDPEQVDNFYKDVLDWDEHYGELDYRDALLIAEELNCFKFTTRRPSSLETPIIIDDMDMVDIRKSESLMRLLYLTQLARVIPKPTTALTLRSSTSYVIQMTSMIAWFKLHPWPRGNPTNKLCLDIENSLSKIFHLLKIPITKTVCCSLHALPLFTMDMLPPNLLPPPFTSLPSKADPSFQMSRLNIILSHLQSVSRGGPRELVAAYLKFLYPIIHFFNDYGWPVRQPSFDLCGALSRVSSLAFKRLSMPVRETFPCRLYSLPVFSQNMLPADLWWSYKAVIEPRTVA